MKTVFSASRPVFSGALLSLLAFAATLSTSATAQGYFPLPYSDYSYDPGNIFAMSNYGEGTALAGYAYGSTLRANGVGGYSANGNGGYFWSDGAGGRGIWGYNSSSGFGVEGQSENANGIGVFAYNGRGGYGIYCVGNIGLTGSIVYLSDARYKTHIQTLPHALDTIRALRGVSFDWRQNAAPDLHLGKGRHIGFIAQEMEKVLPESVHKDGKGVRSVDYVAVVPVLVEAIKEQQQRIEQQQQQIEALKAHSQPEHVPALGALFLLTGGGLALRYLRRR